MANQERESMSFKEALKIGELTLKGKSNFEIAGRTGKNIETVKSYTHAFRQVKAGEPVAKVKKDLFKEVCITLGLPEPIWKEKKAEKLQPAEEPEQLPGQLKMELPEEPEEQKRVYGRIQMPTLIMPEDERLKALNRIGDQLEQISKALWALVKGGGSK